VNKTQPVTPVLAEFIASLRYEKIPEPVLQACKLRLLDTLGVALRGSTTLHAQQVKKVVYQLAGKEEATVFADHFRTTCVDAALANGTMAHSIDFDDIHKFVHPGCSIVPGAIAVAEREGRSGQELLTAIILGYEVATRVGMAVGLSHRYRGFHPTGTCNGFGSAAASAKLLGLKQEEIISALGIAATMASGITEYRYDGSRIKHLHGGLAARNGILAALLAKGDFMGPREGIEGKFGFCRVYADTIDLDRITDGLGQEYEITRTDMKPYPSCRQTNGPVDLALELKRKHKVAPEDIREIKLITYDYVLNCPWLIDTDGFHSPLEAMLNIPFCVAVALMEGKLNLDDFTDEKVRDPRVRALTRKFVTVADPSFSQTYPKERNNRLEITTREGKTFTASSANAKGSSLYALTYEEVASKFKSLADAVIGQAKAEEIIRVVGALETIPDTRNLTKLLAR
jgi:2-methylcitrate dehydratase PrpD